MVHCYYNDDDDGTSNHTDTVAKKIEKRGTQYNKYVMSGFGNKSTRLNPNPKLSTPKILR